MYILNMIKHASKSPIMTIKDACQYLQVSRGTIYTLMKSGRISYIKLAGAVRFYEKDILAFLDNQRIPTTAH